MKNKFIYITLIILYILLYPTGKVLFSKWVNEDSGEKTTPAFIKSATFVFGPSNCIYSVTFPEEPEIKTIYSAKLINSQQAQLIRKNHVLRATCMEFQDIVNFESVNRDWFIKTALDFAEQEGMINPLVEHEHKHELGKIITTIRGSKNTQGLSFKFKYKMHYSGKVRFTVLGGGLTSGYPQSEILPFLDSVERKK